MCQLEAWCGKCHSCAYPRVCDSTNRLHCAKSLLELFLRPLIGKSRRCDFCSISRMLFGLKSLSSCRKSHAECNQHFLLSTRCVSVESYSIGWNKFVRENYSAMVYKCCLTGSSCNRRHLHN